MMNTKLSPIGSVRVKTFLITGATSGIGEACARRCLNQGDQVIALCRNLQKAQDKFGPEISAGSFVPLHYDLSHNDQLFDFACHELKPYSITRLIHCAGFTAMTKLTSSDHDLLVRMFETHVFSLAELVRALLRLRQPNQELSIVTLSSVSAQAMDLNTAVYSMAKASMDYYVQLLNKMLNASSSAKRLPPNPELLAPAQALTDPEQRERAVAQVQAQAGLLLRINGYNPALIKTDIIDFDFLAAQGLTPSLIPMEVVVNGIMELIENTYVSGQSIVVNNH